MTSFLDQLRREIDAVPEAEIVSPEAKALGKGDKVIGVIESLEVKRIRTLHKKLSTELERLHEESLETMFAHLESGKSHDPKTCKNCANIPKMEVLGKKSQVLGALFQASAYDALSEDQRQGFSEADSIWLSENWEIVAHTSTMDEQLEEIAEKLFGRPGLSAHVVRVRRG